MLNRLINENILATKVKIFFARIPYYFVILFFGKKPRIIKRKGITYEVDLSEGIDLSIFLFGKYQEHVVKNKLISISKDAVIIDIGANMGVMSLQFALQASEGMIYSFEPTHYSLNRLKRNLELNPSLATRVEVINSFVSSSNTESPNISAYASWKVNGDKGGTIHPVHLGVAKSTEGVGAITLDKFCRDKKLSKIDLIKIDTDGHEYDVLLGAKETIQQFKPQLVFEAGIYAMTEKNIDFSFFLNYFSGLNYRLYDSIKTAEITADNYKSFIPLKATIDIIALPIIAQ